MRRAGSSPAPRASSSAEGRTRSPRVRRSAPRSHPQACLGPRGTGTGAPCPDAWWLHVASAAAAPPSHLQPAPHRRERGSPLLLGHRPRSGRATHGTASRPLRGTPRVDAPALPAVDGCTWRAAATATSPGLRHAPPTRAATMHVRAFSCGRHAAVRARSRSTGR